MTNKNTQHPNVRRFFALLHSPRRRAGFRTMQQWRALTNAFARWPRMLVARSGRTTWMSCLRCRRDYPAASLRLCLDCAAGEPLLTLPQVEERHRWFSDARFTAEDERDWFKVARETLRDGALVWEP